MFTEKQLLLIKNGLRIGLEDGSLLEFGSELQINLLISNIDDLLRRKRKSLAIERRAAQS